MLSASSYVVSTVCNHQGVPALDTLQFSQYLSFTGESKTGHSTPCVLRSDEQGE